MIKSLRCAIYTRKSSEEGLEQNFNSLHAQRESCAAYILSQAGEGWSEIPTVYDDGGFSGGSMDRPGLKTLLADIGKGLIDVVVVYKVDRLTRSLADFARIVELFDHKGISFVSITQAFNTTTSMGRLTLNVLLSFAQFEREVTGERIRDKIAASKKKGLWMGGRPPLGYDGVDAKLVVNPYEAETVRWIFERYNELGSVQRLTEAAEGLGVRSKKWMGRKGEMLGGGVLARGALYHILNNPVYIGSIRHKELVYPNAHPAIIDQALWDKTHARLAGDCADHPVSQRISVPVLLRGLLFDAHGAPMSASYSTRHGRRYRYYAAKSPPCGARLATRKISRISMGVIDDFVMSETLRRVRPDFRADDAPWNRVSAAVARVTFTDEFVEILVRAEATSNQIDRLPGRIEVVADGVAVSIPVTLKHRQGALIIEPLGEANVAGRVDRALVRGLALSKSWAGRLASGEASSLKAIAQSEGYCDHYAARLLPFAWLAPDLVEMILQGRQPLAISLGALTRRPLPISWEAQRDLFHGLGLRKAMAD
jgi:DNA invertase Pin-like site-specific DNA recombinase